MRFIAPVVIAFVMVGQAVGFDNLIEGVGVILLVAGILGALIGGWEASKPSG
jgi:hypothetical protein